MTSPTGLREVLAAVGCRLPEGAAPIRVLGFDLGTTNSVVAGLAFPPDDDGTGLAEALEVEQATPEGTYTHVLLPSMVAVEEGRTWVGAGAKGLRARAAGTGRMRGQDLFYECKNDMGLRRTYAQAPEGLRCAAEVGGHVLAALRAAAVRDLPPHDRAVVTVPASFTVPQRNDTLRAAKLAGLELTEGDLLDEPVAAFLDYLVTHPETLADGLQMPRTMLVLDFGGGTCDVAVLRLLPPKGDRGLSVQTLAVSRYHRLGGGDVDAAILYEVLQPQIEAQNGLGPRDLTYEAKKRTLEPAFLGIAEALKIGLCVEIRRLSAFGKYDDCDKEALRKTHPAAHTVEVEGRTLRLDRPSLSAAQLERVMAPFLSRERLVPVETEYRTCSSIFGPLEDAIDRAGIEPQEVDLCLLVGGSSLIPQVGPAVQALLPKARMLSYDEREDVKACVARGAAYHALALAATGRPLVQPVLADDVLVRHQGGTVPLLQRGTPLPHPAGGGYAACEGIAFPEDVLSGSARVRLEVSDEGGDRVLFTEVAEVPGPVRRGAPMRVEFRMDANQILRLRIGRPGGGEGWAASIENPLMNVVTPFGPRVRIEAMEEELRVRQVPPPKVPEHLRTIAGLYGEIGQREKAVAFLRRAVRVAGAPTVAALNQLALLYGEMGDTERERHAFEEALRVSPWPGTSFNYALALRRRGLLKEALAVLEAAPHRGVEPPHFVLMGLIRRVLEGAETGEPLLRKAVPRFDPPRLLDDWQLVWLMTACRLLGEEKLLTECRAEERRRARTPAQTARPAEGVAFPILRPAGRTAS